MSLPPTKYILKAYIIHDETLRFRETSMNNTLKMLKMACHSSGVILRTIMVTKPNVQELQKDLNALQERVKYEKTGDPDFDNRMHMLSIEMLTNTEKHIAVWKNILNDDDANTVSLVMEDDAYIMPEFTENLKELLSVLPAEILGASKKWDICFLGTTKQVDTTKRNLLFSTTRDVCKILPSKESYILTKAIVNRLLKSIETLRYTLRTHLSWFLYHNQDIRSVLASKPIFLDGSKIGICTSTIHPINPLVINREFMELWNMQNKPDVSFTEIKSLYKKIEHIRSPDVMHLYGRLLMERKKYEEAEEIFISAVKIVREQNGVLGPSSQLINDAIINYKNLQNNLDELQQKSCKYVEPDRECS